MRGKSEERRQEKGSECWIFEFSLQVWACILEPGMPTGCGFEPATPSLPGRRDLACFVYLESLGRFAYWGRNSDLRLVAPAAIPVPKAAAILLRSSDSLSTVLPCSSSFASSHTYAVQDSP